MCIRDRSRGFKFISGRLWDQYKNKRAIFDTTRDLWDICSEKTWPEQQKDYCKDKDDANDNGNNNAKDNPRDSWPLWKLITILSTWVHDNHCDLTTKSEIGQHSQFMGCFQPTLIYYWCSDAIVYIYDLPFNMSVILQGLWGLDQRPHHRIAWSVFLFFSRWSPWVDGDEKLDNEIVD